MFSPLDGSQVSAMNEYMVFTHSTSSSQSKKEGALLAVNLGDYADTTGAIYGQLAGALLICILV